MQLPVRAIKPMTQDYKPKLDVTAELEPDVIKMYQKLIGEILWAIKTVRVDILHEVCVLSLYQASFCDGNFQQILHLFSFLKKNPKITLYFEPNLAIIDPTLFTSITKKEFRDQCRGAKEELPNDSPKKEEDQFK